MAAAWRDRLVLVTGGTGFIGRSLLARLARAGARLRVARHSPARPSPELAGLPIDWRDGDLRDPTFCARLVDGVEHVFHLAGRCHNVAVHHERCADILTANLAMTVALASALGAQPPVPVVVFSSATVPGDDHLTALATPPVDGYRLGKALADVVWRTSVQQRPFPLLIVRPVGVYGPGDRFAADGHVIPALMVKARACTNALPVWGDGSEERAFVYIHDLITALMTLVDTGVDGIAYVGPPTTCSVRHLAEAIRDLVRPGLPIAFEPARPRSGSGLAALPAHPLLRAIAWTPLSVGLERTYAAWRAAEGDTG